MNTTRNCGCKGYRTCLICESHHNIKQKTYIAENKITYIFCPWCERAFENTDTESYKEHPNHVGNSISYPGVYIQTDFLSEDEENLLMTGIDEMQWELSQSGRRKQNFGPKANFKKKKLNIGIFEGFPNFSKFVQDKFESVSLLKKYRTIEQCSLEYDPKRGASIEPHIDDCWVWGERIVTVNCLSDSFLTMTPYIGDKNKYNLSECSMYPRIVNVKGEITKQTNCNIEEKEVVDDNIAVKLPMPRRSLIVLFGPARYDWEHCVLREDIKERRVCLAYREFTPPYLQGGEHEAIGKDILNVANSFWDHKIVENIC